VVQAGGFGVKLTRMFEPLKTETTKLIWLVVSNMKFIFHDIWDVILPIDEHIFFKMVKTTNQKLIPFVLHQYLPKWASATGKLSRY